VREDELRRLGAHGVIRPSATTLQVVLGPAADRIAGDIRRRLGRTPQAAAPVEAAETPAAAQPSGGGTPPIREWLAALGGAGNVRAAESCAGRVRIEVADPARVTLDRGVPGVRATVWVAPHVAHVLIDRKTVDGARAARALHAALP
jgi:PTS system N-acetylglucosamine-specific IIC component